MVKVEKFDIAQEKDNSPTDEVSEAIAEQASEPDISAEIPKKRRGRPPGTSTKKTKKPMRGKSRLATARMINSTFFKIFTLIGGEEAEPTDEETKELNAGLRDYLETKEEFDIPPGIVLFTLYTQFIAAKMAQPTVYERMSIIGHAVKVKLLGGISRITAKIRNKFKKDKK